MFIHDCKYKWETLRANSATIPTAITAFLWSDWPSDGRIGTISVNEKFPYANAVKIVFTGSDAADESFSYKLYGKRQQNGPIELLLEGVAVLSAKVATPDPVSGSTITNAKYADQISVTVGTQDEHDVIENDGADDEIAAVIFPLFGITDLYLEVVLSGGGGGTAASAGAIITGITRLGA